MNQPTREIDINQLVDDLACPALAPGVLARSLNLTEPQFADIVTSEPVREAMDAVRRIEEARAAMLQARLRTLVLQRLQMLSYHDPIEATEISPEIDARRRETARKATALLAALVYPECHHMPESKAHGPTKPEGMTFTQISAATDALEAEHDGESTPPAASPTPSTPTQPTTRSRFTMPIAPSFPTVPRFRTHHNYTIDPASLPVAQASRLCTHTSTYPDREGGANTPPPPTDRVPGPAKSARETHTDANDTLPAQCETDPTTRINIHTYTLDPTAPPNERPCSDRSERHAERITDPPLKDGSPPVVHTPIRCTIEVPDDQHTDAPTHPDPEEAATTPPPSDHMPGPPKSARESHTHENGHTNGYHQLE